jgi:hypothetical protein
MDAIIAVISLMIGIAVLVVFFNTAGRIKQILKILEKQSIASGNYANADPTKTLKNAPMANNAKIVAITIVVLIIGAIIITNFYLK